MHGKLDYLFNARAEIRGFVLLVFGELKNPKFSSEI